MLIPTKLIHFAIAIYFELLVFFPVHPFQYIFA
nr:MAG TPA: IucA / IucC family [Caudoviricetes sp.]